MPSSDSAERPRTITPPTLDFSQSDKVLRPLCAAALQSLTPMLAIVNHGCENKLQELAAATKRRIDAVATESGAAPPPQEAHALDGDLEPAAEALRGCLRSVSMRMLRLALGMDETAIDQALRAQQLDVQGRLCMRAYPASDAPAPAPAPADAHALPSAPPPAPSASPRLGAHCDATLMTLLWADSPGLEVLDPRTASDWKPEAILRYGLPTMGPVDDDEDESGPAVLRDDQWASVELAWSLQPLLFTVGTSWLSHPLVMHAAPATCAALHRVCLPPHRGQPRHSLPFLADLVPCAAADVLPPADNTR